MKRQHIPNFLLVAAAAVAAVGLSAGVAEAGYLSQLESLQNVNGALRQFKFEGATTARNATTAAASTLLCCR